MTSTWREEETRASDLWAIDKVPMTTSPQETVKAWKQAVKVLDHLSNMADALMSDPLLLALVDAKGRAEEELERARDRAEMGEPGKVHPREHERLLRLLRRCDALGNAYDALKARHTDYPENVAPYLEVIGELKAEAAEAFDRYKAEVGLSE